jgi:hypothetical protein
MMGTLKIGFLKLCELGIFIRNSEGTYDRWLVWTLHTDERRAILTTSTRPIRLGPLIWPHGLRGLHQAILKAKKARANSGDE